MLITFNSVLAPDELEVITDLIAGVPFNDGRRSAGVVAARVKNNLEADEHPNLRAIRNLVMGQLLKHPEFRHAALPRNIAQPLLALYSKGMGYGDHIDDPIMGGEHPFRTDLAVTVFLNSPTEYEGGELVVRTSFGETRTKLQAGCAVLYPASSLHRVEPVSAGERRVMVSWIQSLVHDPGQREILYDLALVRERLLRESPDAADTRRIDKSYVNLVRMWSQP